MWWTNGPGDRRDDQDLIFEKFRQGGDTLTEKPQGTGLGLAISRQIVQHFGGRLWVRANQAAARPSPFTMPLERATDNAISPASDLKAAGVAPRPRPCFVADDEPNIVVSLEYLMKREGYTVSVARDGEEALAHVAQYRPALILLDVMLPLRNGFEVCQKIRQTPEWQDIRIIMLTAKGRETDVAKGLGLGADAYITKPFSTKI